MFALTRTIVVVSFFVLAPVAALDAFAPELAERRWAAGYYSEWLSANSTDLRQDPIFQQLQYRQAVSYYRRGERQLAAGDSAAALESYLLGLGIFDQIHSGPILRGEVARELEAVLIRQVAIGFLNRHYYEEALGYLERYARFEWAKEEWPWHHYISICYGHLYRLALDRTGMRERERERLREKRDYHQRRAIELRYGPEALQFLRSLR